MFIKLINKLIGKQTQLNRKHNRIIKKSNVKDTFHTRQRDKQYRYQWKFNTPS